MAKNQSDVQLKITALIDGLVDVAKLVTEVDKLGGQTSESSEEVERLVSTLDNLRQQDQLISEFQTLKKGTADLSSTLDEARTRATSLGKGLADSKQQVASTNAEYRSSKAATQALADEWQAAKVKVDLLTKGIKDSASPTRAQRDELKAAKEQAKLLGEQYKASSKETSTLEKAMRSTEQAVKLQTREFNAASKEVNQLGDQYIKQSGTLNGLRTQLQQSGVNTKQLAAEQRSLKAAASQVEQQVGQLADSLREQAADQQWLNQQMRTGEKELKHFDSAARQAKGSTKALGDEASASASSFSSWAKGVMASVVALLSIDRAKDAIVDLVSTSADMMIMQKNAERAGLAFDELSQFAEDTSLQLTEVMDIAIKTKNYGLDPMSGALQAATDAAAASGKGYEQVDGILTALGQAYTKTKLQQEEMNQLAERGIPAWTLLAEATGKPIPELQDLASAGELGRKEIELLIQAIGTEFSGAAKAAMNNTRGLASNIGDEFTKAKNEVASAGLMQYVNEQMRDMLAYVKQLREDGTLKEWGRDLTAAMKSVGDYTRLAVSAIQSMAPAIKLMAEAWIGLKIAKWLSDISSLRQNFSTLSVEAYKSAGGITKSALASEMAAASFGKLGPAVRASTTLIGSLKTGLAGLAASWGIEKILEAIDAYRQMKAAQDAAAGSTTAAAQSTIFAQERFRILSEQLGVTVRNMDELDALVEQNKVHFDQATQSWMAGPDPLSKTAQAAALAGKSLDDYSAEVDAAAKATAGMADSALGDVFAKVQLDLDQISGGVGKTVSEFVGGLDTMTKATYVNAQAIEGYLTKAFDATKNKAEIQAVVDKMAMLHAQGKLIGAPYVESLAQATEAAKKLSKESTDGAAIYIDLLKKQKVAVDEAYKKGQIGAEQHKQKVGLLNQEIDKTTAAAQKNANAADDMTRAYSDFGMQSAEALSTQAEKLRASFEIIRSGGEPLEQVKEAFLKYAEAQLESDKANGRFSNSALEVQADTLGLSTEFKALETSVKTTGKESVITAGALDALGKSSQQTGDKIEETGEKLDKHAEDIKNLQEHTRKASSGQLTFATAMMKSSEVASLSLDDINTKMADATEIWKSSYDYLLKSNDISTEWWTPFVKAQKAAQENNLKILGQMNSVREASDALASAEQPTAKLVANAERALKAAYKLDAETLSSFRAAIDSAKQKMEELRQASKSTADALQDELDQYNDNLDAIEGRRYENQVAELKAQLEAAKDAGDKAAQANYERALRLADQLHKRKMQDIADEAAAKKKEAAEEAAAAAAEKTAASSAASTTSRASTSSSAASAQAASQETVTIVLKAGDKTATVKTTPSEKAEVLDLIQQLADAQGVSLS